jgi:hypothetical protein
MGGGRTCRGRQPGRLRYGCTPSAGLLCRPASPTGGEALQPPPPALLRWSWPLDGQGRGKNGGARLSCPTDLTSRSLQGPPPKGEPGLDSCFRRNDTVGACLSRAGERREAWIPAYAGRTRGGRRKEAWIPACAGMTQGPLTRPGLWPGRPLPRWGEAFWSPHPASLRSAGLSRGGERREAWIPACAGRTRWGRSKGEEAKAPFSRQGTGHRRVVPPPLPKGQARRLVTAA